MINEVSVTKDAHKVKVLEKRIEKQQRFIDTWTPILNTLETKDSEEAINETKEFIRERITTVQALLDKNTLELHAILV